MIFWIFQPDVCKKESKNSIELLCFNTYILAPVLLGRNFLTQNPLVILSIGFFIFQTGTLKFLIHSLYSKNQIVYGSSAKH